jgi:protein gp37
MSDNSRIEWTEATWNPVTGCTKVSDGCLHCYIERTPPFRIERMRFDSPDIGGTTGVILHQDRLEQPLHWLKPRRIFVNSLADLFHEAVNDDYIARVFAVMALTRRHTFQVLTKRHARMRSLLGQDGFRAAIAEHATDLLASRGTWRRHQIEVNHPGWTTTPAGPAGTLWAPPWPLPNLWLGVSVEDQHWADIRIPALLATPATVRWLSCEPLLGSIDLTWCAGVNALEQDWIGSPGHGTGAPHPFVDWVVVGGESGPGARPMHPDWPRSLRDQCTSAGVPFFFKQWGEWAPLGDEAAVPARIVQMRQLGKKRAGRALDGRTWDEYPAVTA